MAINPIRRRVGNCKLHTIGIGRSRTYKSDAKFKPAHTIPRVPSGLWQLGLLSDVTQDSLSRGAHIAGKHIITTALTTMLYSIPIWIIHRMRTFDENSR